MASKIEVSMTKVPWYNIYVEHCDKLPYPKQMERMKKYICLFHTDQQKSNIAVLSSYQRHLFIFLLI